MLKSIQAKNFLSWESLKFNIESGVTLIQGYNHDDDTPEGSGKSAILNALSWCIYGKLPKEANIDDVIREGQKSCEVQIEFGHDFIVRTRKPNDLFILKFDGTEHKIIKGKDAKETQKMIEDLVGLSFEAFCQSIYFAQNNPKKFITSNQEEKGKILSEVQDLEIFDNARKEVLELQKIEKTKLEKFETQIREFDLKIEHSNQTIQILERNKQEKIKESETRVRDFKRKQGDLVNKIEENDRQIQEISKKIETLNELNEIEKENLLKNEIDNLKTDRSTIKAQLSTITQQINILSDYNSSIRRYEQNQKSIQEKIEKLVKFIEDPTSKCPTCGTVLSVKDTKTSIKEISGLEKESSEIQVLINELLDKKANHVIPDAKEINEAILSIDIIIKNKEKELTEINQTRNEKVRLESSLNTFTRLISQINSQLQEIQNSINQEANIDFSNIDIEINNQINNKQIFEDQKSAIQLLKIETDIYLLQLDTLKSGFREIKTYVFNSVLNEVMHKTNKYLESLFEIPVKILFSTDDLKINTEIFLDGVSRGFGLCSGGQQQRIILATNLAISDVVTARKGSKLGLIILDEPFQNLSEPSMIKCIDLLDKFNKSVLLIEHNTIAKSIVDKTFEIEYKNKVSRSI